MQRSFDLIIVGGGMVGASLARSLADSGLRIAVIEAWALDSSRQPSYDDRAIALAWGSRQILEGIGVWPQLAAAASPIHHIHVSDRGHFGFTRLHRDDLEVAALGYIVSGHALGRALLQGLGEQNDHLQLFCPATLTAFHNHQQGVEVQIDHQGEPVTLQGRLLVAADGARSMIRQQLAIEVSEWGYGQTAVICNLTADAAPDATAYERFTASGPMAMLPLGEGRFGLVWTLDDADVKAVLALDDEAFLARVQQLFGYRVGRFSRVGHRSDYPLKLLRAKTQTATRVALLGNAAHALHPITGQGFNLGIRDVAVLADLLADAAQAQQDIGADALLDRYSEWRRRDQQAVALITDGLVRLFTNPLPPLQLVRNLGLLAMDNLPPAKRLLTRQFMGLNGRLPRLARGLSLD